MARIGMPPKPLSTHKSFQEIWGILYNSVFEHYLCGVPVHDKGPYTKEDERAEDGGFHGKKGDGGREAFF